MGVLPGTLAAILASAGSSGPDAAAILAEAIIDVDWLTAADTGGAVARNAAAPAPTANVLAFPVGPTVYNESGQTTSPTIVRGLADPRGGTQAFRLDPGAINQVYYLFRAGTGPLPAGTYTLRLRARSNPGSGAQSVQIGPSNGYTTITTQDVEWTDAVATTFTLTFSYNGTADIGVRLPATTSRPVVCDVQLYPGSTVPAWATESGSSGRRTYAFAGALPIDAAGLLVMDGLPAAAMGIDTLWPERRALTEYTVMVWAATPTEITAATTVQSLHTDEGGSTTNNVVIIDPSAAPQQLAVSVGTGGSVSSRSRVSAVVGGREGLWCMAHSRTASKRRMWVNGAMLLDEDMAWAGGSISRWYFGGYAPGKTTGARNNLMNGSGARLGHITVWPRVLTDAEEEAVWDLRRQVLAGRGATMQVVRDMAVLDGDSNWQNQGLTDFTGAFTAKGGIPGQAPLTARNTSVGGTGLDAVTSGVLNSFVGTPLPAGRYAQQVEPTLLSIARTGRVAWYYIGVGTNDWNAMSMSAAAYAAIVQEFIDYVCSRHSLIYPVWCSLLPQTNTGVRVGWEAWRTAVNAIMVPWLASHSRASCCDFGGSSTIGSYAEMMGANTYYNSDQIHLSLAGNTAAASIAGAHHAARRVALGIA